MREKFAVLNYGVVAMSPFSVRFVFGPSLWTLCAQ